MANKTITVYDGKRYLAMTAEPILVNGEETGHYKDIDRVYLTINGIFDNELIKDEVINFINSMHEEVYKSDYYILEGEEHYPDLQMDRAYLFSSFALSPKYESLGEAVVARIRELGWVVNSYEIINFTYLNDIVEIICFHYIHPDNSKPYWDLAYLIPVEAETFKG